MQGLYTGALDFWQVCKTVVTKMLAHAQVHKDNCLENFSSVHALIIDVFFQGLSDLRILSYYPLVNFNRNPTSSNLTDGLTL